MSGGAARGRANLMERQAFRICNLYPLALEVSGLKVERIELSAHIPYQ